MAHYNSVNQLTSFNSESFSHDANGNLKDDGVRTYQWDAENRLISISYKNDASKATAFRHDGMRRRLAIVETNGGATTETRYLWCGATLCQARTAGDIVTRRYYPQGMAIPQGGTLLYYGTDHLGSVRDVMAAQNGAKVASYDYDPYGNPITTSGRISVDFRYAGMFYHQQSGLYLTNYRAYDPRAARWLSRDPIAENGGLNLYGYVRGNPVNATDPIGLDVVYLNDSTAAVKLGQPQGHAAFLVGGEALGWSYFSKDGYDGGNTSHFFPTLDKFFESQYAQRYDNAAYLKTSIMQDLKILMYAKLNYQNPFGAYNDCADLVHDSLQAGGIEILGKTGFRLIPSRPNKQYDSVLGLPWGMSIPPYKTRFPYTPIPPPPIIHHVMQDLGL